MLQTWRILCTTSSNTITSKTRAYGPMLGTSILLCLRDVLGLHLSASCITKDPLWGSGEGRCVLRLLR
jgi:hypothetical protein